MYQKKNNQSLKRLIVFSFYLKGLWTHYFIQFHVSKYYSSDSSFNYKKKSDFHT